MTHSQPRVWRSVTLKEAAGGSKRMLGPQARFYAYLVFCLFVLMASWEASKADAAVVDTGIPSESIRLRILANSDAPRDQWVKAKVRDAIVERMNAWVKGPESIEDAREIVIARMSELQAVAEETLERNGFDQAVKIELGQVPFPAKMYGGKVYPAGNYEALRVTLGEGAGQNWWCVLFPPLCFVDEETGEAVEQKQPAEGKEQAVEAAAKVSTDEVAGAEQQPQEVEKRFFLVEMIMSILHALLSLFS